MASKKDFRNRSNRANEAFFSKEKESEPQDIEIVMAEPEPTERGRVIPEGYYKISRSEPKNKRIQLLITQTVYDKMKDRAFAEGISFNELALRTFETFLESI